MGWPRSNEFEGDFRVLFQADNFLMTDPFAFREEDGLRTHLAVGTLQSAG